MSFSSRRRNYLLTPHRRDGLIEWMKSMLMHSFVLNALQTTGADTFSHFEMLIDEHRESDDPKRPSRLKQLVPTVGTFHTRLPLRRAFEAYNAKYALTARRRVCISFNEIRHILNLAQIMALSGHHGDGGHDAGTGESDGEGEDEERRVKQWEDSPAALLSYRQALCPPPLSLDGNGPGSVTATAGSTTDSVAATRRTKFRGPSLITFDGDQTLYSDGANFDSNPKLASYLYLLLKHGVTVAVVTAAGYEYQSAKYELRLSGLLSFFKQRGLTNQESERFYLFGGECNYLLRLGQDYALHPVNPKGPGGWITSTLHVDGSPGNWDESSIKRVLDVAESSLKTSSEEQRLRSRVIRKKRAVGLIPRDADEARMPREALDEAVLRVQEELSNAADVALPYCAFNGGRDAWVDVGNKRVGVQVLQCYLGIELHETLHIGDQFLNTGNDYAARDVCPCVWITSPEETTYILKSILRLAGVSLAVHSHTDSGVGMMDGSGTNSRSDGEGGGTRGEEQEGDRKASVDFAEMSRRTEAVQLMDVYTGEILRVGGTPSPKPV